MRFWKSWDEEERAAAVRRLEFHQITVRRSVFQVLSGGEEGAL